MKDYNWHDWVVLIIHLAVIGYVIVNILGWFF